MLFHQHQMRLASLSEENLWRNKKLENGTRERRISRDSKMRDSIYCNQLWSKEKKKLKKSMPKELKKSDSKRLKIKSDLWPKSKEKESRF